MGLPGSYADVLQAEKDEVVQANAPLANAPLGRRVVLHILLALFLRVYRCEFPYISVQRAGLTCRKIRTRIVTALATVEREAS